MYGTSGLNGNKCSFGIDDNRREERHIYEKTTVGEEKIVGWGEGITRDTWTNWAMVTTSIEDDSL